MATRHIPVYVITTDDDTEAGPASRSSPGHHQAPRHRRGARAGGGGRSSVTPKEATARALDRRAGARRVGTARRPARRPDVSVTAVGHRRRCRGSPGAPSPDCLVLNPRLSDVTPVDFAKRLLAPRAGPGPCRCSCTATTDGEDHVEAIKRAAPGLTVKDVRTEQRLLDQTALYLHAASVISRRPSGASSAICTEAVARSAARRALIVDDDIRNIFALPASSRSIICWLVSARNGRVPSDLAGVRDMRCSDGYMMPEIGPDGDHAADGGIPG